MKKLWLLAFVLCAACGTVNYPDGHGGTGTDDSNTANSLSDVNPASIGNNYATQLYNFLTKEDANRYSEQGFQNYVSNEANANACLGAAGAGLTMTPTSCIAYNAGFRGTETGSITFVDNSTTWVAMDENTTGSNANLANFSRVSGTHYLIDSVDASPPTMASDSQLLMKVVTSGGAITAVTDLRNLTPLASGQNQGTNGLFNTITGTGTTPALSGFNGQRQGEINLMAYGASGLGVNVTTATGTATQNTITVANATGWLKNQGIIVNHAGAAVTLSTPGAPTITPKGTTGATTYTYKVCALTAKRGITVAGAAGSTASGNAALTGTDYNQISWSPVANAWGYAVYRTVPSTALVAVTTGTHAVDTGGTAAGVIETFAELPATAPASSLADWLQTTISSINGTTFTLAANLTTSITAQEIGHDDTTPITNAFNAAAAANKMLYVPQGTYFFCGTPLNGASINFQCVPDGSNIITCDNQYLILENSNLNNVSNSMRDCTFAGGLGAYHNTSAATTTSPLYSFEVDYTKFVDFTGLAWGIEPGDSPRNKLDHCFFQALDENKSIGVLMPGSFDNQILNSQFQNVRISVKTNGGSGLVMLNDTTLSANPIANVQSPRIGVWDVPAASGNGAGMVIGNWKFGNENLSPSDARIAVLDDGSGADESIKMPNMVSADDLSITSGAATLTSAAECPFTSAMCQGGAGCTGTGGNWPVIVRNAGQGLNTVSDELIANIAGFTNSCTVTLSNNALATVSGQIARMAPASTGVLTGAHIVSNLFLGLGTFNSASSLLVNAALQEVDFSDNLITGGMPPSMVEAITVPGTDTSRFNTALNNELTGLTNLTSPGQGALSNVADLFNSPHDPAQWFSRNVSDPLSLPYPLVDTGTVALATTFPGGGFSLTSGAAFVGAVADSFGKPASVGDADEFSFTNGGLIGTNTITGNVANVPMWIYFETHSGSVSPVNRIFFSVNDGATNVFQRPIEISTGWRPWLFKYTPIFSGKTYTLNWGAFGTDSGRIQIGRMRVYQGWTPPPMVDQDINGQLKVSSTLTATTGIINGCKGDVTLAAGSGTFTNACVTTASACEAKDITTPANACTVAAPGAGSVTVTGTGTDHCRTWCE